MNNPTICGIFDQLDRDRHVAGYPLENRASPFFRQFLPTAFKGCLNVTLNPTVIPEFPYEKDDDTKRSPRVDFFALSEDGKCAFFVELKTDMNSLGHSQTEKLRKASERGTHAILSDITSMAYADDKQNRQKYFHMLKALKDLKLIEMPPDLEDVMYRPNSQGVFDLLKQIEIKSGNLCHRIIYILPREHDIPGSKVTTFENFADAIKGHGEIGERFAKSLRCWAEVDPGTQPPAKP